MVTGSRIEGGAAAAAAGAGGTQFISARVRNTIQSIKEIVGNHSDADIYVTLKETNMDPNETAQKLLNQDPFHEVKRKRDKKKEITGYKGSFSVEPRKPTDQPRRPTEHVGQVVKFNTYSDRNVRRGGFIRNTVQGPTREFRVVRDNRTNQNAVREMKPPLAPSSDLNSNVSEKSSSAGISNNQKQPVGRHSSQHVNGPTDSRPRQARENSAIGTDLKDTSAERQPLVSNAAPTVQSGKANDTQITSLNNSVVGVYSSSSDPVHVPSLDARPAANVGAIKREVGAVGARRQASENSSKLTTSQTSSSANTQLGRDGPSRDTFRSFPAMSKSDQPAQTNATESAVPSMSVGRSFLNNQHSSRSHQQVVAHQKAAQPNKEWKPKSSQKPSVIGPGVIGTPTKSVPSAAHNSKDLGTEADQLQDKLSRANIHEKQNVIIAAHIRVSETDRCRLTFGSLGTDCESSRSAGFEAIGGAEESVIEPSASVSPSAPESSSDETSGSKQVESLDDRVRSSGSVSPTSAGASEHQMKDRRESPSPQNLESYADIGLVRENSPSYTPSEQQQQQQNPPGLQHFSAYDSQGSYDIPYFRSAVDESGRGQVLPIPHEVLSSHAANSIPASTIAMVQQQQAPVAQMYPQVHFANLMTYPHRQFLSPVYVPPIAMPGYANNPTYSPHPSNGSSYLLMPGANSAHLSANGLKYGIQQFKPLPAGSATGFGNFTSPAGYAMNAPGVVGGAAGLDDSSRLKYKDGNLYVPNPQAETSELWMNPRDIPSMQSASYYNMTAQTPHAAYMPSHTGHASFSAAPQSSHMQFQGMYHPPPQPAAIANPHHMGGPMGGNAGVGVAAGAPGAQVGGYQQPQMGHMSWSGNF